ncbi:DUF6443 domain-containing protein [Chitinophaga sp. MM2321]|uniref:DUF6443 domain-containing protein n=1 Tax=Chitinophaga sp. MM2321 TaxID=3137178 RepID=UPI0032D57A6E
MKNIIKVLIALIIVCTIGLSSQLHAQCTVEFPRFMDNTTGYYTLPISKNPDWSYWSVSGYADVINGGAADDKFIEIRFTRPDHYIISVDYQVEGVSYNNCWEITIGEHLVGGTISGPLSSQGSDVFEYSSLINVQPASFGIGTTAGNEYQYEWQESSDGINWEKILVASGLNCAGSGYLISKVYFRRVVADGIETAYSNTISVNPIPVLKAGTISASQQLASQNSPSAFNSTTPSGGSQSYTYKWEKSEDEINWVVISGATSPNYQSPAVSKTTYFRRKCISDLQSGYSNTVQLLIKDDLEPNIPAQKNIQASAPNIPIADYSSFTTANFNKVVKATFFRPGIKTISDAESLNNQRDVQRLVSYADGLGRIVQGIAVAASYSGKDLVAVNSYDQFGQVPTNYLSYYTESNTNNGAFRADAAVKQPAFYKALTGDDYFYQRRIAEDAPEPRYIMNQLPGKALVGNNIGKKVEARVNSAVDKVRLWVVESSDNSLPKSAVVYESGQLVVKVTTDEHQVKKTSYIDKQGKLIMTTEQEKADNEDGQLRTCYVYDEIGQLRYILPPLVVKYCITKNMWDFSDAESKRVLSELGFQYLYDEKGRNISYNLPGSKSPDLLVYDNKDRIVFFQDASLKGGIQGGWILNIYDNRDRIVMKAIYKDINATRESLQTMVNQWTIASQTITYKNAVPAILNVDKYEMPGVYEAKQEILFNDGFETPAGGIMEAGINPFAADRIENIVVNSYVPAITGYDPLIVYYYDNYNWDGRKSFSNDFVLAAGSNLYPEPVIPTQDANGKATGMKVKVLGKDKWLSFTVYYDEKGRIIQSLSENIAGGTNITTGQYDFKGNQLSLYQVLGVPSSTTDPVIKWQLRTEYDALGNPLNSYHTLYNTATPVTKTIISNVYSDYGQLKSSNIGNLETLNMSYALDGSVKAINGNFVSNKSAGNFFGIDLSFENGFSRTNLSGELSGTTWRRKGNPDEMHAYGYTYDNAKRLSKADYSQNVGGNWNTSLADYSTGISQYDENGNIKRLKQEGVLTGNIKSTIDDLTYFYGNNGWSNKLEGVTDAQGDKKVGDFKNYNGRVTTLDYDYNDEGSLIKDRNKGITVINNYLLNKPEKITVDGATVRSVEFVYDATGVILQKIVTDGNTVTTYTYIGDAVYKNNELMYMSHPAGRVRKNANGKLVYDYFLSDHLGNVRTVLTEETNELLYRATHEDNPQPTPIIPERETFSFPVNIDVIPSGHKFYDYQGVTNRRYVKLNGSVVDRRIGTGKVLKVMAGDKIDVSALYYYQQNSPANNTANMTPAEIVNQLINVLLGPVTVIPNGHGNLMTSIASGVTLNKDNFTSFISNTQEDNPSSSVPKAYLNYVLFDENLNFVNGGARRVEQPDEVLPLLGHLDITKNGYLYVYLNNESPSDVYFDNLVIKHTTGPLLQEDSYYPFGLQIRNLSSKALNRMQNNQLFNGIDKLDEFELELYTAFYRTLDPQIGRWWQVDPAEEKYAGISPYNLSNNNPANFSDPLGDDWFTNGSGAFIWLWNNDRTAVVAGEIYRNVGKNLIHQYGDHLYTFIEEKLMSIDKIPLNNLGKEFVTYFSNLNQEYLQEFRDEIRREKISLEQYAGYPLLPEDRKDQLRKDADVETMYKIKTGWTARMSGTDPEHWSFSLNPLARANFNSYRAYAVTSVEEGRWLATSTLVDVTASWITSRAATRIITSAMPSAVIPKPNVANSSLAAKGGMQAIEAGEYTITKTVANNLATRPYINSPYTITNIMKSGKGVPDAFFKGGVNYKVPGAFNSSNGIFELGINPETNTIYHFLFKTVK